MPTPCKNKCGDSMSSFSERKLAPSSSSCWAVVLHRTGSHPLICRVEAMGSRRTLQSTVWETTTISNVQVCAVRIGYLLSKEVMVAVIHEFSALKVLTGSFGVWMLQNRPGAGGGVRYTITERIPIFLRGFPPPTRFALPAARGKTSLNARDWWKGKELFI